MLRHAEVVGPIACLSHDMGRLKKGKRVKILRIQRPCPNKNHPLHNTVVYFESTTV